jgi:DNA helicase IV
VGTRLHRDHTAAKGLECRAIILGELDGIGTNESKRMSRLYVAISRATQYLVVLGAPKYQQVRQPRLLV